MFKITMTALTLALAGIVTEAPMAHAWSAGATAVRSGGFHAQAQQSASATRANPAATRAVNAANAANSRHPGSVTVTRLNAAGRVVVGGQRATYVQVGNRRYPLTVSAARGAGAEPGYPTAPNGQPMSPPSGSSHPQ